MNMSLALMGMSGGELAVVMVLVLVLFGAKKIPEFAKGLGKGIAEFKKASTEVTNELQNAVEAPVQPARPAPQATASTPAPVAQTSAEAPSATPTPKV
jgi:sec-independent protein translocase protein TatA